MWGRRDEAPTLTKLSSGWRLRELGAPTIVAKDILDIEVPDGARLFCSGIVDPELTKRCEVHSIPPVRSEFALSDDGRRALLFTAGVQEGTWAVITRDPDMISRLQAEGKALASRGDDYRERLPIAALAGRSGVAVETQGLVQDVLPYKQDHMIRLEDQGAVIGVVVAKDPTDLLEERILVRGELRKDATGYAVIHADEIRRIR